jgi:hypothetical protein
VTLAVVQLIESRTICVPHSGSRPTDSRHIEHPDQSQHSTAPCCLACNEPAIPLIRSHYAGSEVLSKLRRCPSGARPLRRQKHDTILITRSLRHLNNGAYRPSYCSGAIRRIDAAESLPSKFVSYGIPVTTNAETTVLHAQTPRNSADTKRNAQDSNDGD